MATILNIETSTNVCSVALTHDGVCLRDYVDDKGPNHAVSLGVFVDEALSFMKSSGLTLDAVAVSSGPGSYTGLRIGVSMAKGLCYGFGVPLLAVPTLQTLAVPVLLEEDLEDNALLVPMIDARRMEVYAAIYDKALNEVRPTQADIVEEDIYEGYAKDRPTYFFGNGAGKLSMVLCHENERIIPDIQPLASNMMPLSERLLREGKTEDVAYFVPFYLKDFVAKKPKPLF